MSKWQNILRKVLKTLLFFGFAGLFVFILTAASLKRSKVICKELSVSIQDFDEMQFINEEEVIDILNDGGQNLLINKPISELNLEAIEERLEAHSFISVAEIHTNFDGMLKADIQQKRPLFRVFNNQDVSYYVSQTGTKMPLSSKFTPRLIVATGNIPNVGNIEESKTISDLKLLIEYILDDSFWTAMVGQVHVNAQDEFVLYPKIDGAKVLIGDVSNLDSKFRKLRIFYKEAMPYVDWQQYETINLKYNGQIVCSKK